VSEKFSEAGGMLRRVAADGFSPAFQSRVRDITQPIFVASATIEMRQLFSRR
jgi:hypothetical protein